MPSSSAAADKQTTSLPCSSYSVAPSRLTSLWKPSALSAPAPASPKTMALAGGGPPWRPRRGAPPSTGRARRNETPQRRVARRRQLPRAAATRALDGEMRTRRAPAVGAGRARRRAAAARDERVRLGVHVRPPCRLRPRDRLLERRDARLDRLAAAASERARRHRLPGERELVAPQPLPLRLPRSRRLRSHRVREQRRAAAPQQAGT